MMSEFNVPGEQKAGNRLGCLLVLLPTLAFLIVMPDALHVWQPPWSNPMLWLLAAIAAWFGLRWLIDGPIETLRSPTRVAVWGALLGASGILAALILRST